MSIISKPEVTPNRTRSIVEWLSQCKGFEEEEDKLKRFLIPAAYDIKDEEKKSRRQTFINPILVELTELGIIIREENMVKLSETVIESYVATKTTFPVMFSDFLFNEKNHRQSDFLYAVAWILSINPFNAPGKWPEFEVAIKRADFHAETGMTNSNPHSNFNIWCTFLGFSWNYQRFMPDPTEHIGWRLKRHFYKGEELTVGTFLEKLKVIIPVIDGGHYRMHEKLTNNSESNQLSISLSLALKRLQDQKFIRLEKRSDTDNRSLSSEFGSLSISHIIIN